MKFASKSFLFLSIVGLVFIFSSLVSVAPANAQTVSTCNLVNILILIGVITPQNSAIAQAVLNCPISAPVVSIAPTSTAPIFQPVEPAATIYTPEVTATSSPTVFLGPYIPTSSLIATSSSPSAVSASSGVNIIINTTPSVPRLTTTSTSPVAQNNVINTTASPVIDVCPTKITYVAMGASETLGTGASSADKGYAALIKSELSKDYVVTYKNLGIGGATAEKIISSELNTAISAKPTFVTLFVGGNDIRYGVSNSDYSDNLDYILSKLKQNNIKTLVANVPDLSKCPQKNEYATAAKNMQINAIIAEKAAKYDYPVIDVYHNLSDHCITPGSVSSDGIHPNDQGYRGFYNAFIDKAEELLSCDQAGTPKSGNAATVLFGFDSLLKLIQALR